VLLVVRQPAVKSRSMRRWSAFGPRSLRFKLAGDPGVDQKRLKAFPPISTDIAGLRPSISLARPSGLLSVYPEPPQTHSLQASTHIFRQP